MGWGKLSFQLRKHREKKTQLPCDWSLFISTSALRISNSSVELIVVYLDNYLSI